MGNSEVGHLNLGAGRIVYQDISRIANAIAEGSLAEIPALQSAIGAIKAEGKRLHLIGLLGSGGVHSHSDHLYALLDIARRHDIDPLLHLITDGRDSPTQDGIKFCAELLDKIAELGCGRVATVSGRYYAMDRDRRWERTRQAYNAMAFRRADARAPDALRRFKRLTTKASATSSSRPPSSGRVREWVSQPAMSCSASTSAPTACVSCRMPLSSAISTALKTSRPLPICV